MEYISFFGLSLLLICTQFHMKGGEGRVLHKRKRIMFFKLFSSRDQSFIICQSAEILACAETSSRLVIFAVVLKKL